MLNQQKNGVKYIVIIKIFAMAYVYKPVKPIGIEIECMHDVLYCLPYYLRIYIEVVDSCRVEKVSNETAVITCVSLGESNKTYKFVENEGGSHSCTLCE